MVLLSRNSRVDAYRNGNFWDHFISIVVRNLLIPVPSAWQLQRGIKSLRK